MRANEKTLAWLRRYYELMDSNRLDEAMAFLGEDSELRFANGETLVGRKAIRAALDEFLGSLNGIRHELKQVWEMEEGMVIYEAQVTYTRKDNVSIIISGVSVCELENDLFKGQRIYVDLAPLYA